MNYFAAILFLVVVLGCGASLDQERRATQDTPTPDHGTHMAKNYNYNVYTHELDGHTYYIVDRYDDGTAIVHSAGCTGRHQ